MSARDFLFQKFKTAGIPEHLIAGILGNAQAESNFDPAAFNSTGGGDGALGIFQWRGPRQRALKDFAEARGTSPMDLGTQADFFLQEANGSESSAWKKVQATDNPLDAFDAFRDHYERSGGKEGDRSGYKRGRSFTGRIYRDYTDPSYHFSTPDDAAAEAAKYPADPDPYAPSEAGAPNANYFEQISRGFPGNKMATGDAVNRIQALTTPNQPTIPRASPSSLINADPARGDSFPYVTGADIQPNGQAAPGVLNPYMAGVAPVAPANPEAAPTIGNAVAGLSPQPPGADGAGPINGVLDTPHGRAKPAPPAFSSNPFEKAFTPEGTYTDPGSAPEVSSGLMSPDSIRDGISASTAPEPSMGDEKDPWNWKLGLFEGLEGLGVGLGQMSHGTDINIGGVRERINNRKAGEANSAVNQQNADTNRMQENRLAQAPKAQPINRQAVATMAQKAGLPQTTVDAISADLSGTVAEQVLGTLVGGGDKPINRQAIAEVAKSGGATPQQVQGILDSDLLATQFANSQFRPEEAADSSPPLANSPAMAEALSERAMSRTDPTLAAIDEDYASRLRMDIAHNGGKNSGSLFEAYGAALDAAVETAGQTGGKIEELTAGAQLSQAATDKANEFSANASSEEKLEAGNAAKELFKDRDPAERAQLVTIAMEAGLPAAIEAANNMNVASETQEQRNTIASHIRGLDPEGKYESAAKMAETSGEAGLEEYYRMKTADEATIKKAKADQRDETYITSLINGGHADVAEMFAAGEHEKAADLYMQKTKETPLPADIRTIQYLMEHDENGKAEEMLIRLRNASTDKPDSITNRQMRAVDITADAIAKSDDEMAGLREIIDKTKQAQQIVNSPGFNAGPAQALTLELKNLASSLGFDVDEKSLNNLKILKSIGKGLIPLLRGTGGGAMSDKDSDNIESSYATVSSPVLANKAILQFALHRAEVRKIEINAIRDNFINGGALDSASTEAFIKARMAEAGISANPFAMLPRDENDKVVDGVDYAGYLMMLHNTGRLRDGAVIVDPDGVMRTFDYASTIEYSNKRKLRGR